MTLASLEVISEIKPHPNADRLEIASVLGFESIIPKGVFEVNQVILFIRPDTVLPDKPWAEPFKKMSAKRVRAIKIRGTYSMGIVISPAEVLGRDILTSLADKIGKEIATLIGVTKYEAPVPKELNAKGPLPFGIFKTDEDSFQSLDLTPFVRQRAVITLKIDGQSATYYCKKVGNEWVTGICSRSLELKPDCNNQYTQINNKYKILDKLLAYCQEHNESLALRGEIFGQGIQAHGANPDAKGPVDFRAFSVLNLDNLKYKYSDGHFVTEFCNKLEIPSVPILEFGTVVTKEKIKEYQEKEKLGDRLFEGVVFSTLAGSFKVINMNYDSRK